MPANDQGKDNVPTDNNNENQYEILIKLIHTINTTLEKDTLIETASKINQELKKAEDKKIASETKHKRALEKLASAKLTSDEKDLSFYRDAVIETSKLEVECLENLTKIKKEISSIKSILDAITSFLAKKASIAHRKVMRGRLSQRREVVKTEEEKEDEDDIKEKKAAADFEKKELEKTEKIITDILDKRKKIDPVTIKEEAAAAEIARVVVKEKSAIAATPMTTIELAEKAVKVLEVAAQTMDHIKAKALEHRNVETNKFMNPEVMIKVIDEALSLLANAEQTAISAAKYAAAVGAMAVTDLTAASNSTISPALPAVHFSKLASDSLKKANQSFQDILTSLSAELNDDKVGAKRIEIAAITSPAHKAKEIQKILFEIIRKGEKIKKENQEEWLKVPTTEKATPIALEMAKIREEIENTLNALILKEEAIEKLFRNLKENSAISHTEILGEITKQSLLRDKVKDDLKNSSQASMSNNVEIQYLSKEVNSFVARREAALQTIIGNLEKSLDIKLDNSTLGISEQRQISIDKIKEAIELKLQHNQELEAAITPLPTTVPLPLTPPPPSSQAAGLATNQTTTVVANTRAVKQETILPKVQTNLTTANTGAIMPRGRSSRNDSSSSSSSNLSSPSSSTTPAAEEKGDLQSILEALNTKLAANEITTEDKSQLITPLIEKLESLLGTQAPHSIMGSNHKLKSSSAASTEERSKKFDIAKLILNNINEEQRDRLNAIGSSEVTGAANSANRGERLLVLMLGAAKKKEEEKPKDEAPHLPVPKKVKERKKK